MKSYPIRSLPSARPDVLWSGLAVISCLIIGACKPSVSAEGNLFEITLTNTTSDSVHNYGVHVDLIAFDDAFTVLDGDASLPIQLEDRNANDIPEILFVQTDLPPNTTKTLKAVPGKPVIPSDQVHVLQTTNGDVVLENDWIGYRLLNTAPYAIDALGKRRVGGFAFGANDLPSDRIIGDQGDILREGSSLGIGAPALFDLSQIVDFGGAQEREIHVHATGPLRAEVQLIYRAVPVRNERVDISVRHQLQAGHPWMDVEVELLTRTNLTLQIAFGLPKLPEASDFTQGRDGTVNFGYTYGLQSSEGEHLGLAVMAAFRTDYEHYRDDPHNYFFLVGPGADRKVSYRVLALWGKSRFAVSDEFEFLGYVRSFVQGYQAVATAVKF